MIPEELRYHTEHEWLRLENQSAVLGITHFAQDALGDVVYLELPKVGATVQSGQEIGEVESTKTTSPIYTPVSGKILVVNEELREKPELVNKDPYGRGWIAKIQMSDPSEAKRLMDARQYGDYLKSKAE
ncbi:MAG TPA: glycine cleavage system protein GcvH [Nitrospiria bacterium]|jgi:glycine cleavage system H protein|nr:glycine cleavage system protein GcvH [Nitrospiria bacterium]